MCALRGSDLLSDCRAVVGLSLIIYIRGSMRRPIAVALLPASVAAGSTFDSATTHPALAEFVGDDAKHVTDAVETVDSSRNCVGVIRDARVSD